MSHLLHPRFLQDPAEYDKAASEWHRLWNDLSPSLRSAQGWKTPWVDESWRDGNPIFSAWSPAGRRGIRILQHADESEALVWWRDTFAAGTADAVDQLVLSCPATLETIDAARSLLLQWLRGDNDPHLHQAEPIDLQETPRNVT